MYVEAVMTATIYLMQKTFPFVFHHHFLRCRNFDIQMSQQNKRSGGGSIKSLKKKFESNVCLCRKSKIPDRLTVI